MVRLLIDENVDHRILRGIKLRLPSVDFLLVKELGLEGSPDIELLQWAAQCDRVILTHDVSTMTRDANQLVKSRRPMAGVILIPETLAIGIAVKNLELLLKTVSAVSVRDRVTYLPLRAGRL